MIEEQKPDVCPYCKKPVIDTTYTYMMFEGKAKKVHSIHLKIKRPKLIGDQPEG